MLTSCDEDLNPVLEQASDEELGVLHDIIMKKLTEMLSIKDAYKLHYPEHSKYADLIADELRDFGGNTIANVFRGEGPPYREIVSDVAKAIKAPFNKDANIVDVEASILATMLAEAYDKMTEAERLVILEQIGKSNKGALGGASAVAFQAMFKAGGFASYKLTLIVVNAVVKATIGRGLPLVANAALARTMAVATGPIGWAVTSVLTVIQLAGPSYKVTIPSVAFVAMLRRSQHTIHCSKCDAFVDEGFSFCPECGAEVAGND